MADRINKPRVFLSHAKADKAFIERLHKDLKKCQIEPWLDSEEIRHGQPWLSAIFEDGLPTCDCVLIYFTEKSLSSEMVKKEADAGVIRQLQDKKVRSLPYVDNASIRTQLRADFQVLQVPEWNDQNYKDTLPRVVAEIWRSYFERKLVETVKDEKVLRLEAELELEKLKAKSGGVFSLGEIEDFEFIYKILNRTESFHFGHSEATDEVYGINILSIVLHMSDSESFVFSNNNLLWEVRELLYRGKNGVDLNNIAIKNHPNISAELLRFGLLTRYSSVVNHSRNGSIYYQFDRMTHKLMISDKMEKFKYWMAFDQKLPSKVIFEKS